MLLYCVVLQIDVLQKMQSKASKWINAVARTGIEKVLWVVVQLFRRPFMLTVALLLMCVQGLASVPQLESLLKQLPDINVDLSEFSSKLKQAVRLYCVCRNPYRPPMVSCKACRKQVSSHFVTVDVMT